MDEWETVDAAAAGPAAGQLPAAEAEPSADAHAEALWRSLVTDRRYSGTVQMIQNKLRDEKSPKDKLRTSFVAAATGYILPDKITRRALAALPSMEIEEEWASALQPVVKRLGEPEKEKAGGGSSAKPERSADLAGLEQAKSALLMAIWCIFSPDSIDDLLRDEEPSPVQLSAVPASLTVAVSGNTTLPCVSTLLAELAEAGQGSIDGIDCSYDLREANRQRTEWQEAIKASARARQLYGRSAAAAEEPPAAATVPCTFTLRGTDSSALLRAGEHANKSLRAQQAAKRSRECEEENSAASADGRKKRQVAAGYAPKR